MVMKRGEGDREGTKNVRGYHKKYNIKHKVAKPQERSNGV